jgi:hypothetical protein
LMAEACIGVAIELPTLDGGSTLYVAL